MNILQWIAQDVVRAIIVLVLTALVLNFLYSVSKGKIFNIMIMLSLASTLYTDVQAKCNDNHPAYPIVCIAEDDTVWDCRINGNMICGYDIYFVSGQVKV